MRHNRQAPWHKTLKFKRGGSSGGGGGASTGSQSSQDKAPTFRTATPEETSTGITDWEQEFIEMLEAKDGSKNKYSEVDRADLEDSLWISRTIHKYALLNEGDVIAIKDSKGNIQAGVQYTKKSDHLYIEYLATAPWNFTKDSRAVRGAGTKAIIEAIKIDKKQGGSGEIRLYGLEKALPFYQKLGFKPLSKFIENDLRLSAADANKLLEKFGEA
jgi:hypothetical protein